MVIPKPLCKCPVCEEARVKGPPYERTGPSAFIHDENWLIDTPAEIISQLNRSGITKIDYLTFTHLDPDHVEGFRLVEQAALDFRSWAAFPEKQICLVLPDYLFEKLRDISSAYGPVIDFYEKQGFVKIKIFKEKTLIGETFFTAIPVDRGSQVSSVFIFEKKGRKAVYAPCDIRPFPEYREDIQDADLLVIQPGLFEHGLKYNFCYPEDHISRATLYTFEETMALAKRIRAQQVLFVHIEEYWNRSYDDYLALQNKLKNIRFAYDGMRVTV